MSKIVEGEPKTTCEVFPDSDAYCKTFGHYVCTHIQSGSFCSLATGFPMVCCLIKPENGAHHQAVVTRG